MGNQDSDSGVIVNASKKLSAKTLIGDIKSAIVAAGGHPELLNDDGSVKEQSNFVELYRVVGIVTGVRTGATDKGDWIGYTGAELAAIVSSSGEIFQGREILLPEEGNIALEPALKQAGMKLVGESTSGPRVKKYTLERELQVAIAVEAKLIRSVVGYQYRVKPLMPIRATMSPALELLARFGGDKAKGLLQLAGPDAEPKGDVGDAGASTVEPIDKASTARRQRA